MLYNHGMSWQLTKNGSRFNLHSHAPNPGHELMQQEGARLPTLATTSSGDDFRNYIPGSQSNYSLRESTCTTLHVVYINIKGCGYMTTSSLVNMKFQALSYRIEVGEGCNVHVALLLSLIQFCTSLTLFEECCWLSKINPPLIVFFFILCFTDCKTVTEHG